MLKRSLVTALFCTALTCTTAQAQNLCPTGTQSDKLVCLIPQVYGPSGLVLQNTNSQALGVTRLQNGLPQALGPLNTSIARQAALLPLASPSSGITFSWDPTSKVFVASTDSFGPVLGERAETMGKYRVFVGLSYQYFKFDSLDGISLNNLPAVFTQPDTFAMNISGGTTCSLSPPDTAANTGRCGFIRDIVTTKNSLDLKLHQYTTFVTFGLTNRVDVSMAIPIENIRMATRSDATIVNISQTNFHQFAPPICSPSCVRASSSSFRTASGIGDITFRVKGTAWKGERAALALGVDVRVPSGDALNFLGAGATGFKPFLVWSYRARISPHAFVGYEANGSSKIGGDITTGSKEKLPGQLVYSGGADAWLTKWLSAAFDLVGQQVFQAPRLTSTKFVRPRACKDSNCNLAELVPPPAPTDPNLVSTTGSYSAANASIGVKIKPFGHFLVTGNVLIKLNDSGLRAKTVPLAGVSYTF